MWLWECNVNTLNLIGIPDGIIVVQGWEDGNELEEMRRLHGEAGLVLSECLGTGRR